MTTLLCLSIFVSGLIKKGEKFIPFSLVSINDEVVTLTMEEGKLTLISEYEEAGEKKIKKTHPSTVLIDFWATWCVPCRKAMPHLQKIYEKYKPGEDQTEGGMVLLGIAIDRKGLKVVKPFFKRLKMNYNMLAGPTTGSSEDGILRTPLDMKFKYGVDGIPVVLLVDTQGTIEHVHVGFKESYIEKIERAIEEILSGNNQ